MRRAWIAALPRMAQPDHAAWLAAAVLWLALPPIVQAHIDAEGMGSGGFLSGLRHPVTGLDHIVAMVAVGIWGAQLGGVALWLLPVVFPLMMAFGGMAGVITGPLPGIEIGVAASAIVLGALVAREQRLPLWAAIPIVGAFAVFHGHTHGTALPDFGVPILFAAGFVISTGLLHMFGILIGLAVELRHGRLAIRVAGAVIALVGVYFLVVYAGM